MSKEILKGTSKVSLLTILSRIFGFIWSLVMARVFGAGVVTDTFFIAYRVPNMLRSFFAEGAMTSAFVPVFTEDLHESKEKAQKTLRSVSGLLLITTIVISVLGIIFAPSIIQVIAPGFTPGSDKYDLCVLLTRATLPYIIFTSIVALINSSLISLKIYGAAQIAQISMNIVLIAACCWASFYNKEGGIVLLGFSVVAGGVLQVMTLFPSLRRAALNIIPSKELITQRTKRIMLLMMPAFLGAAVYQISIFVNTMLASMLPTGSVSWLFYAERISQLPIGILTIALASVLLPLLSKSEASGNEQEFRSNLVNSLRYISFLIIPASFGLIALSEPIIRLLFERGEFSPLDTTQTAFAIQAMSVGLWGISCNTLLAKAYLAKQDTLTPSLLGLLALIINILIALVLMGEISTEKITYIGGLIASFQSLLYLIFPEINLLHVGLAFSTGISLTIIFFISVLILKRRMEFSLGEVAYSSYHSLLASCGMIICLYYLEKSIDSDFFLILVSIPISLVVYFIIHLLLSSKESKEIQVMAQKCLAK